MDKRRTGFDSLQGKEIFHFSILTNTALGLKQSPIELIPGALSPGVKQSRREANYSPPSRAEVKNGGPIPLPYAPSWTGA